MKRFILTESQMIKYVERKKVEGIYYTIIEEMYKNKKFLNENISLEKANQSIINHYRNKNLITPEVFNLLIKHRIINENYEII